MDVIADQTRLLDQPFGPFVTLLLIILGIAFVLILITASQHRKHAHETESKICPGCATPHPSHAQFCRQCGKKL